MSESQPKDDAAAKASPDGAPDEPKRERKRLVHDPLAPKRPLTPYFSYVDTVRPRVVEGMTPMDARVYIHVECQRRWAAMSKLDQKIWFDLYERNLRLYRSRTHSYKEGGNPNAREMTDAEAAAYADENNIT